MAAALAVGALAAGSALLGDASASKGGSGGKVIVFGESKEGAKAAHISQGQPGDGTTSRMGDVWAFSDPAVDLDGNPFGVVLSNCVTTVGNENILESVLNCTIIVRLEDGDIMAQGAFKPAADATGAIVGGTGAYANARGTFITRRTPNGVVNTLRLAG